VQARSCPSHKATAGDYVAQVFGKGNANNASSCYTLKVTFPTGGIIGQKYFDGYTRTNEPSSTLAPGFIKIFPNPVNSILQLYGRGWTIPAEVEVYQMNGIKAFRQRLQPGWQTIDVSRLASGLYLLRIKTPSGEIQVPETVTLPESYHHWQTEDVCTNFLAKLF
jgi:hypothetical protein